MRITTERDDCSVEHKPVVADRYCENASAIGFASMMNAADLDGIGVGADKKEPVVANAQSKFISALKRLHVAHPDSAKRCKTERTCIASGLLRLRTSALARLVQTIRFTAFPESC